MNRFSEAINEAGQLVVDDKFISGLDFADALNIHPRDHNEFALAIINGLPTGEDTNDYQDRTLLACFLYNMSDSDIDNFLEEILK